MQIIIFMDSILVNDNNIAIHGLEFTLDQVYAFVHDLEEPVCNHFAHVSTQTMFSSSNSAVFHQQYHYLGSPVKIEHHISMLPDCSWSIKRLEPCIPCRFGISIPVPGDVLMEGDQRPEPLINYEHHWRYNWAGQTNLDLPILKLPFRPPLFVTMPLEDNVQFFSYAEKDQKRLKIATMYEEDCSLNMTFAPMPMDDYRAAYVFLQPEAYDYVYQWKTLFKKIKQKHDITVMHQIAEGDLMSDLLNNEELTTFSEILDSELDFYPAEVTSLINRITVCGNIRTQNAIVRGHRYRDGILINGSGDAVAIKKAIHHEIFHLIDDIEHVPLWDEEDAFFDYYKLSRAEFSPGNYRAEIFAHYVVDPGFTENFISKDATVRKKWDILFSSLSDCIQGRLKDRANLKENTGVINTSVETKESTTAESVCFVAAPHACSDLVDQIVPGIAWHKLDRLLPDSSIVCLTVNPLDYCAHQFKEHRVEAINAMEEWINFHKKACQFDCRFLHSEKFYQAQWAYLKRFFAGIGFKIDVQSLKSSENMRSVPLRGIPTLESIWKSVRGHPIMGKTGYHRISMRE